MTEQQLDDGVVFDRVINALLERPRTFSELFGNAAAGLPGEPLPKLDQVHDALNVLEAVKALKIFRETRFGERMKVFALKSEARTYVLCEECEGKGVQDDVKRGLCYACHGNGMVTPSPKVAV